jgi:hypothetical protein
MNLFTKPSASRAQDVITAKKLVQHLKQLARRGALGERREVAQVAKEDRRGPHLALAAEIPREEPIAHDRLHHAAERLQDALALAERRRHGVHALLEDADLVRPP